MEKSKPIFVSYSRIDKNIVFPFVKRIEQELNTTCWIDFEGIESGSQFEEVIVNAIEESKVVLFMLSDSSISSNWTKREVLYAEDENKRIVPIAVDGKGLRKWFKFHFGNVDYIDINDEGQCDKLLNNLASWIGVERMSMKDCYTKTFADFDPKIQISEIGSLLYDISPIRIKLDDIVSAKTVLLHEIEKRCGTKDKEEIDIPCRNDIGNVQYDVFISCKSEDYPFARKVYQFLREQNYNVFLADTELRKKGNADYGEIIDEALDSATHMVIVATQPEYIMSAYVKSEWRTFIEEKKFGRKKGNIFTLIEFSISELPFSLRQFRSFNIKSFDCITDFLTLYTDSGSQ